MTRTEVPTKELINVVADTIEKIYEEFGGRIDRLNAKDKALMVVGSMKHGIGGYEPLKIREHELDVPRCRACSGR